MSILHSHFSPHHLTTLLSGVRCFISLQGLRLKDPHVSHAQHDDLLQAIMLIAASFVQTESMIGKRKYVGVDFDAPQSVKRDILLILETPDEYTSKIAMQHRNNSMYVLVLEPFIEMFYALTHAQMVEHAVEACEELVNEIEVISREITPDYTQATQASHQLVDILRSRDQKRAVEAAKKNKRRKSRDPMEELLASLGLNEEANEEDWVD